MRDLIVIQECGSEIAKLRAPKTTTEVLNALGCNGVFIDEEGVLLLGSNSLEAGCYAFKQVDAPSTTTPILTPVASISVIKKPYSCNCLMHRVLR